MLVVNLILWPAIIIATIAMYIENNTAIKGKNRVLIGVTVSYEHIKDSEVLDIVEQYKKGNKLYIILGLIAFIPSIIISIIPIVIVLLSRDISLGLIISASTGLLGNIILFITYRIYCKKSTDVHTEDPNVNIAYNLVFKRMWTMGIAIAAAIQSIGMILIFLPMTLNYNSMTLLILSMVIPPVVIVSGIYYINYKVSEEQNRLLETSNSPIYVDDYDDEYWYRDI